MYTRSRWAAGASLVGFLLLGSSLTAQQRSRISGTVTDEKGNPVKGAVVQAENPNSMPSELSATTDGKGRFAFGGLKVGTWKLTVTADGYHGYGEQFRVSDRQNVRKEIVLKRATGGALLATSEKARAEIDEARKLFDAGDYDSAIEMYKAVLAKAPEVYQIHFNMALALERNQDYQGAAEHYRLFLEKEPNDAQATLSRATALMRAGKIEEAVTLFEKAAGLEPQNAIASFNLGLALFQTQQLDRSAAAFERSLERDPTLADAHFMLGHIHLSKGDAQAARQSYEKFLELAPDSPNAAAARDAIEKLKQ
jgi:tetratricopeptide (TPR) repeat protein